MNSHVTGEAREKQPARTPESAQDSRGGQTLPHDPDVEKAVLSSILISPLESLPTCQREITPDHFFLPQHRIIYQALLDSFDSNRPIDLVSFTQTLRENGLLEKIGGPAYVTGIYTFLPSAAALKYYLGLLKEKHTLRATILSCSQIIAAAQEPMADPVAIVAELQKQTEQIRRLASPNLEGVENFAIEDLRNFDPAKDDTIMLGGLRRWLGRGYTSLWAAPAGAGKSTLEMQLALYWACGCPCFGITPTRPLKSLIVQAENDLGDTAEQFQGVVQAIKSVGDINLNGDLTRMIVVNRLIGSTGMSFLASLRILIKIHSPDLVWIDPLFAFVGCDLIDTEAVSNFLRNGLIPIAVESGTCIHVIHHATKTSQDSKAKSHWAEIDYQYLGFGSSEIQNAFRAVNVLIPVPQQENVFRLILAKRGSRAGALNPDGEPTCSLYLAQAKTGILWTQIDKPDPRQQNRREGQYIKDFTPDDILGEMSVVHGRKTMDLQKYVCTETGMSRATFYRLFGELKTTNKIQLDSDNGWVKKSG